MNKIINGNMQTFGELPVSVGLKHLKEISQHFGLRLHVARELKLAIKIFIIRHSH